MTTFHIGPAFWGAVAACGVGLGMSYLLTGFPLQGDYSKVLDLGIFPDVLHERATAWEAIWGDPYRPISEIMPEHGYPEVVGGVSPRTPAGLLLQLPLLLVPDGSVMRVVTATIVALVALTLWMTHRISGLEWSTVVWAGPLIFISHPVLATISYGSVSVMATVILILAAWAFRDESWSGVPLGLAAAMRLWPGLIIIGFWISGRGRAAYQAIVVFVVINAAGLLLPGVTLEGSTRVLLEGTGDWINHNQNASLALVVSRFGVPAIAATLTASILGVWLAWRHKTEAIAICVVAALLASPLSWPTYLLATLPILATWWREGGGRIVAGVGFPFVFWFVMPSRWRGHIGFAALVVLLFLAVRKAGETRPREDPERLSEVDDE